LGPSNMATASGTTVQREIEATLGIYQAHLADSGLYEPPPFSRRLEQRRTLVGSLMERGSDLQELIRSGVGDERIIQLCAPEHLMLLETEANAAELIKFAPRAAREYVGGTFSEPVSLHSQDHPVEWTAVSPVAGVLRLVPLRASAIEQIWQPGPSGPAASRTIHGRPPGGWPSRAEDEVSGG
jgi:hypothetical protein